jgi:putative hydrolase of the HAD superfamily
MRHIDAVAFDLDGTLYPNYQFYIRVLPFIVKEFRLMNSFRKARKRLHAMRLDDPLAEWDFYTAQAFLMARDQNSRAGEDETARMRLTVEKLIYRGWEPLFKRVRLFPRVKETLAALKRDGFKLGLLSDFPPNVKLENLGLSGLWDAVICSEEAGRLKPDPRSFLSLADALETSPDRVLYVGNSARFDAAGAAGAGMLTALKVPFAPYIKNMKKVKKIEHQKRPAGNFAFSDYRYLYDYVLLLS